MGLNKNNCLICGHPQAIIYRGMSVPVDAVHLYPDQSQAIHCRRGDLVLGYCEQCEFISNLAFDPDLVSYGAGYNPSQANSRAFNAFHRELATRFVDHYGIRNRTVLEIGCGEGEFLFLLDELGGNRCTGFDPACTRPSSAQVTLVSDYYLPERFLAGADLVCCKMTLEHIREVRTFVLNAKAAARNAETLFFFQVPDVGRILNEAGFWDLYYEHCSYFSRNSLVALLASCGFSVVDLWSDFGQQYLMVTARIGPHVAAHWAAPATPLRFLAESLQGRCENYLAYCRELAANGGSTALWGGGSKGMAFADRLGVKTGLVYAIDIDPLKQGNFLPGSGLKIEPPEIMQTRPADQIIIMNPWYQGEIEAILVSLHVSAKLIPLGSHPSPQELQG